MLLLLSPVWKDLSFRVDRRGLEIGRRNRLKQVTTMCCMCQSVGVTQWTLVCTIAVLLAHVYLLDYDDTLDYYPMLADVGLVLLIAIVV